MRGSIHEAEEGSEKHLGDSQEEEGYKSHPVVRESRYQLNYHKLNKKIFLTPKEKGKN